MGALSDYLAAKSQPKPNLTQANILPSGDGGPLADPQFRSDVGGGVMDALNRGMVGQTLGAPVDIANILSNLGKAAYGTVGHATGLLSADQMPDLTDTPVGGSEWIGKKMQDMGIVSGNRNPTAEMLAGALAPVLPGATRAMAGAARGASDMLPVIRDSIEHGMSVGGQYPEMIPPRRFRGPALDGMPDGGTVKVDGKPYNFGTDQRLTDIAQSYANDNGTNYSPPTTYKPVDTMRAKGIAQAYNDMPHDPQNPDVAAAYQKMMQETQAQYEKLTDAGYTFDFMKRDAKGNSIDPYGNPRNAIIDLIKNKHMSVFPTADGYGEGGVHTFDPTVNPLLAPSPHVMGDGSIPTTQNDLFRAVHDAFGHGQYGVGFRAGGEDNAFRAHARMYSPDAVPAATSELRGQNSYVNYGPDAENNAKASPINTKFAPQKSGVMPDWTWKSGADD